MKRIVCCAFVLLLILRPVSSRAEEAEPTGTAADAAQALRYAESRILPETALSYDWTGNYVINTVDAEAILRTAVGQISDKDALQTSLKDSLIGEQFLDKFSYGEVQTGEYGSYRSDRISITVNRVSTKIGDRRVVYFLADIYLRDIHSMRTAISDGSGGADQVFRMTRENNAILAMSGDFFRARSRGLAIRNGELIRKSLDNNRDICVLYEDGVLETVLAGKVDVQSIIDRGAWQAWCFGPALLDADGLPKTEFNTNVAKRNPRAAIGFYSPGHYCFLVVDGRQRSYSYGVSMAQLSELMYDLGCSAAYNLDGGATAVLATKDDVLNRRKNEDRECSDIVFLAEVGETAVITEG